MRHSRKAVMKTGKKVLIYIDGDEYIRNYFTFNSLALKGVDVVIYANKNICSRHILMMHADFKGYIKGDEKRRRLRFWQCDFVMKKFITKSKSFMFRFNRYPESRRKVLGLLSLPGVSFMANFLFNALLKENPAVVSVVEKECPDLIIIPTQIASPMCLDLIDVGNRRGIKTLCLIDGWDNISSKTIFPTFPSYIAVWGDQSVDHAFSIQGFPKEKAFKIGTPRFESYTMKQPSETHKEYDFKYILFTGCAIPFDEISALKLIDHALIKNHIKDIKIVYRPHPWRQKRNCFDFFIPEDFENVILDKQMVNYYQCSQIGYTGNGIQPSLKYYPDLLGQCLFTISPLTTMIVEAALAGKYVMTLAYDDGVHYTNPRNALNNYEHFEGIEKISAFKFCYNFEDIPGNLLQLINLITSSAVTCDFKQEIKYIIDPSGDKYADKLNNVVDEILGN